MRKKANTFKRYDREFKLGAVKLVIEEGQSFASVAEALGTTEASVRSWVTAYEVKQEEAFPVPQKEEATPSPESERAELERLREENRILKMERDILKKTIVLFAGRPQ